MNVLNVSLCICCAGPYRDVLLCAFRIFAVVARLILVMPVPVHVGWNGYVVPGQFSRPRRVIMSIWLNYRGQKRGGFTGRIQWF